MKKNFEKCPSCTNTSKDDPVYRCDHCNTIYCTVCIPKHACNNPRCGKPWTDWGFVFDFSTIGYIQPKT